MEFLGICLVLTDRCNASCDICCFSCNPQKEKVMSQELMESLIEQAAEVKELKAIGFSGGEPFLYYEQLMKGLKLAKTKGFQTSVATNGFWGKEEERCVEIVKQLKELQVDRIFISTDDYHQQFVPKKDVLTCIGLCKAVGLTVEVVMGETKGCKQVHEVFQQMGEEKYLMNFSVFPYIRAGNAKKLPEEEFYKLCNKDQLVCQQEPLIAILPDGTAYPCCAPGIFDTALTIGDGNQDSLADILKGAMTKPFYAVLKLKGLGWFLNIAEEKLGDNLQAAYTSGCEFCNLIFSDKDRMARLLPYVEEEYNRLLLGNFLGTQKKWRVKDGD